MATSKPAAPALPGNSLFIEQSPSQYVIEVPFFNTTFSTHRVSPLFVGRQGLTTSRLEQLARRLRDTLVVDVVRGIQVGIEATDTSSGQVGPLRSVVIRRFQLGSILGYSAAPEQVEGSHGMETDMMDVRDTGLWIEISHENAAYEALLLPGLSDSGNSNPPRTLSFSWTASASETEGHADSALFFRLPLLLLRMPQPLKKVFCGWISTTFDCHVSPLVLGTKTLISVWESWIRTAGIPCKGPDFVLTVAFNAAVMHSRGSGGISSGSELNETELATETGLRTLDITIAPSDLGPLLQVGIQEGAPCSSMAAPWEFDNREHRRLAGGNPDDGWAWRGSREAPKQPFTEGLARYLDHHLALNLFHPSVRVVRISCGSFVLAQSKLKIVKLGDVTPDVARAAWMFVTQLGARVDGNDHFLT